MRTKSIILSNFLFIPYFLFSQNVGIGTTTPAGRIQPVQLSIWIFGEIQHTLQRSKETGILDLGSLILLTGWM